MESLFSCLDHELTHHERLDDREQARAMIFEYIEVFYNRQRLPGGLDYRSPADFVKMAELSN